MTKYFLFLFILALLSSACGKKDTVKPDVEANGLKNGIVLKVVVPLTEDTVAKFDSPVEGTFNLLRGVVKSIYDLGAGMGAGKVRLDMVQPLPEIPTDYIKDIRVKRVFFYMEPVKVEQKRNFFQRMGDKIGDALGRRSEASFEFLNQLVVSVKPQEVKDNSTWVPAVSTGDLSSTEKNFFKKLFNKKKLSKNQQEELEKENGKILVSYEKSNPDLYLNNKDLGRVSIIYTNTPIETRRLIEEDPVLTPYYNSIYTLKNSLLLELPKDRILQENFDAAFWEKQDALNILDMESCTKEICMDFKVADMNLIPILTSSNGIKINTLIDARKTPESFQLKGFMEFEIRVEVKPKKKKRAN